MTKPRPIDIEDLNWATALIILCCSSNPITMVIAMIYLLYFIAIGLKDLKEEEKNEQNNL